MQPNEAFKLGFMSRCVEEGLSEPRIRELVKRLPLSFPTVQGTS